jgi:hypothetical protein
MTDTTIEVQFFDVGMGAPRRVRCRTSRSSSIAPCRSALAFAGRRIRAVDDSGRVVWT